MNANLKRKVIDDVSIQEMHHMRDDELMSNSEIAQAIGCNEVTIYKYLGRQPSHIRKKYTRKSASRNVDEGYVRSTSTKQNGKCADKSPDNKEPFAKQLSVPYKSARVSEVFTFDSECVTKAAVDWEHRTIRLEAKGGIGYYPLKFEDASEIASIMCAVLQYAEDNETRVKEINNG